MYYHSICIILSIHICLQLLLCFQPMTNKFEAHKLRPGNDSTRCHCYMIKKKRFCNQKRRNNNSRFCGNHAQLDEIYKYRYSINFCRSTLDLLLVLIIIMFLQTTSYRATLAKWSADLAFIKFFFIFFKKKLLVF